jgi:hypothetical protein
VYPLLHNHGIMAGDYISIRDKIGAAALENEDFQRKGRDENGGGRGACNIVSRFRLLSSCR